MEKIKRNWDILTDKERKHLLSEIIGYFEKERDEVIGMVAAENILNFFLQHIGPLAYNKAIEDTKKFLIGQIEGWDIDLDLFKKPKI